MIAIRNPQKMLTLRVGGFLLGLFLFPLLVIGVNSGFEIQPRFQRSVPFRPGGRYVERTCPYGMGCG